MNPARSLSLAAALLVALSTGRAAAQSTDAPPTPAPTPAPAPATTPPGDPAQAHVDAAMALYAAADLAGALDELTRAHAMSPRPDILFGIARIHMERGDCVNAMRAYRTYLESRPGPSSTQVATEAIESCQKILAAMGENVIATEPDADARARDDARTPQPSAAAPASPPAPAERRRVSRGWYRDPVGGALVAGALVGVAGGGALYASARADVTRANRRGPGGVTLAAARELDASAQRKQRWALAAGGAGAALAIAGALRYTLADHTDTIEVSPPPTGTGATVTLGWSF